VANHTLLVDFSPHLSESSLLQSEQPLPPHPLGFVLLWLLAFRALAVRPESLLAMGEISRSLLRSRDFAGSMSRRSLRCSSLSDESEEFICSTTSASLSIALDIHTNMAPRGFTIIAGNRSVAVQGLTLLCAIFTDSSFLYEDTARSMPFSEHLSAICFLTNCDR
jgi:hypothetical protein